MTNDDTTGQTGASKTWRVPGSAKTVLLKRMICAHFTEARGITPRPSTGRIYGSNPVPVIERTKPCKTGGDHIRVRCIAP